MEEKEVQATTLPILWDGQLPTLLGSSCIWPHGWRAGWLSTKKLGTPGTINRSSLSSFRKTQRRVMLRQTFCIRSSSCDYSGQPLKNISFMTAPVQTHRTDIACIAAKQAECNSFRNYHFSSIVLQYSPPPNISLLNPSKPSKINVKQNTFPCMHTFRYLIRNFKVHDHG